MRQQGDGAEGHQASFALTGEDETFMANAKACMKELLGLVRWMRRAKWSSTSGRRSSAAARAVMSPHMTYLHRQGQAGQWASGEAVWHRLVPGCTLVSGAAPGLLVVHKARTAAGDGEKPQCTY